MLDCPVAWGFNKRLGLILNPLINKGWEKVHSFSESKNKLSSAYFLTSSGIAEKATPTDRFLQREFWVCKAMGVEIESLSCRAAM